MKTTGPDDAHDTGHADAPDVVACTPDENAVDLFEMIDFFDDLLPLPDDDSAD